MANPVPIFLGLVRLKFCPKNQMRQQVVAGECDDDDIGRMIEGAWITWSKEVAHASAPCMVVSVMMIEGTW